MWAEKSAGFVRLVFDELLFVSHCVSLRCGRLPAVFITIHQTMNLGGTLLNGRASERASGAGKTSSLLPSADRAASVRVPAPEGNGGER
jgi:hypothetical protein